jgi:hypothetical protein
MAKPNVAESRRKAMDDGSAALVLRERLVDLLEDTWAKKRQSLVQAYRRGEATYPLLLGITAQLAMAEELLEELNRRVTRGRIAKKEELDNHGT